jgi:zinc protease
MRANSNLRSSWLAFVLAVTLLTSVPSSWAQAAKTPPGPATPPVAVKPSVQTPSDQLVNRTLPNGLEVIVLADHSVPLVTVEIAVKNGSYTEPPELNGLSHLYEHMFFRSNDGKPPTEAEKAEGEGGSFSNGETREEIVIYYTTSASPYLGMVMRNMRDAALYPRFDQSEFERERQVVIAELDRHESNPNFFLDQEMTKRLWYKYPSRKNPAGNRQTVSTATTDMMRLIQGRYYVPNNSALVITGDVDPEKVFALAQSLFGEWKPSDVDPFVKFPLVEHPPLKKSESGLVIRPEVENVFFQIGWHGPSIGKDNASTYAADVFSYIVGQPNSRFQRALVDTGLVQGANINYYTQRNVGPINILARMSPEQTRAAIKAIYNEVAHFNDPDYFTDEELDNAKTILAANDLFDREKLSDYGQTIAFWWASTGLNYFRGYQRNLKAVTRADISRYIKTYIQNRPHVALVLISEAQQTKLQLKEPELLEK